jgi:hypothetical protein
MPPSAVRSVGDLIFWQYAKIISESACVGKTSYGFIMDRYKKLQCGEINWSTSIREYVKERESPTLCIYCGIEDRLTLEHILPTSRGGPDIPDNAVWVCGNCNSSKGSKRLYEWYGLSSKDKVPRIAEGKYLKLLYILHTQKGTLDETQVEKLCANCDMEEICPIKQKLTVYCLEGCFNK